MKTKFEKWLYWFDNYLVWENHVTGEKYINDYFELDINGLWELHSNIDELDSFVVHLENTYSDVDDAYNKLIDKILKAYEVISISWMEGFTITDSELFEFIKFDEEGYANELIQEDPNVYDENLDVCVENAMSVAHERYLEMKDAIEDNIIFLRNQIEMVVQFLGRVHEHTLEYANR